MPMPPDSADALLRRRDHIAARLADPNLSAEDTDLLCTEAEQVRVAIDAHNRRAALLGTDSTRTANTSTGTAATRSAATARSRQESAMPTSAPEAVRALTESEQFASLRANGFRGAARVEFPNLDTRALITTTTGDGMLQPERVPGATLANADRPLRIVDLIDQRTTTLTAIERYRDTTPAGTVATEVAEGNLKPEAAFTFETVTDPVRTIAHWVPITRQAADDSPSLVQHVEARLMYGLDYRVDAQVLNGNGTDPNLRGILNTAGIGTYAAPAGEAPIISVRKGLTVAQRGETTPDGVVLNPLDWERIELSTDSNGMFRVSPTVSGTLAPRLWGLNVVVTNTIAGTAPDPDGTGPLTATTGRFLVGAFQQGATLWNRDSALLVSDNVGDDFLRNRLVMLAERRVALSVMRPGAFVAGEFAA